MSCHFFNDDLVDDARFRETPAFDICFESAKALTARALTAKALIEQALIPQGRQTSISSKNRAEVNAAPKRLVAFGIDLRVATPRRQIGDGQQIEDRSVHREFSQALSEAQAQPSDAKHLPRRSGLHSRGFAVQYAPARRDHSAPGANLSISIQGF